MTVNDYREFCEIQFSLVVSVFNRKYYDFSKKEVVDNAVQRILGAGDFAQQMGISFNEVESVFNFYKEKMQKLLK